MRLEIPATPAVSLFHRDVSHTKHETLAPHESRGYKNNETYRHNEPQTAHSKWLPSPFLFANRLAGPLLAAIAAALAVACGSGLTGPAKPGTSPLTLPASVQCTGDGLASQDLAGQCRSLPTTMGALEATGASGSGATSLAFERVN